MAGIGTAVPDEEADDLHPDQAADGAPAADAEPTGDGTQLPPGSTVPAPDTSAGSAAQAAGTVPAGPDALQLLMQALTNLSVQSAAQTSIIPSPPPRPFVPDYRKEFNWTTWPIYSGDFKTFRKFKKEVSFTLTMLPA